MVERSQLIEKVAGLPDQLREIALLTIEGHPQKEIARRVRSTQPLVSIRVREVEALIDMRLPRAERKGKPLRARERVQRLQQRFVAKLTPLGACGHCHDPSHGVEDCRSLHIDLPLR